MLEFAFILILTFTAYFLYQLVKTVFFPVPVSFAYAGGETKPGIMEAILAAFFIGVFVFSLIAGHYLVAVVMLVLLAILAVLR